VVLFIVIISILGFSVNRVLKMFILGMERLARGEFSYRIQGNFDKMSGKWLLFLIIWR